MRGSITDGEDAGTDANQASALPRSAACGPTKIPTRAKTAASSGSEAGDDPPSPPAPFIPLGRAVSAVVMRIENSRLRLKVSGPVREVDRAEW